MKLDTRSQVGVRRRLSAAPFDLAAAIVAALLADAIVLAGAPRPLRLAAALPLLFFLPGYAVVAALYPEPARADGPDEPAAGVRFGERLALAFGVSVALLPPLALLIWVLGLWVSPVAVALVLTGVVLVGASVGAARRLVRPPSQRFVVPVGAWLGGLRARLGSSASGVDRALNVALALAVLLAVGALGYGLVTPVVGESYTSATLLTDDGDELVAADYPEALEPGESAELVLELANHEGADQSYAVVVQVERVETAGGTSTVTEADELDRLGVDVPAGESRRVPHEVAPETTGERLRLSYYVYRGDAPGTADAESAYRHLYIWLSVGA